MQETREGVELDKLSNKLEEDPPLSGAYIRSLVKQLTSTSTTTSKPKDTNMNTKDQGCVVDSNVSSSSQNLRKHGKVLGALQQQHKKQKQVRRRLHNSRPYQERLLNMAEARKEIVTALKFHRASMKQAMEQQQEQQQHRQQQKLLVSLQPSHHPSFEQDGRLKYWRNPRIHPSCTTQLSNSFMDESDFSCSFFSYPLPSLPNYYTLPIVSQNVAPPSPPLVVANPIFSLPNQTLRLNLTFHDFNNLDPTLSPNNNNNNNSSFCSYSSPTSIEGVSSSVVDTIESSATTQVNSGGLHATIDDEGMAEMRSLGEKYQMEWNDTMDLVTSARWSNFLNNMEHGAAVTPQVKSAVEDDAYHHIFDELIEFPAWLNANDSCLEQSSEDYFKDIPW